MKFYKVLADGVRSYHYGEPAEWPLPRLVDGKWAPGEWLSVEGRLVPLANGLHLTSDPRNWWVGGAACYEVEWRARRGAAPILRGHHARVVPETRKGDDDGDVVIMPSDHRLVVRRARLLRELDDDELHALGIHRSGSHSVESGHHIVEGTAHLMATGSARVLVCGGSPIVDARGRGVRVDVANGYPTVYAFDADVYASGKAFVDAQGASSVTACDHARVNAYDSTIVKASDHAAVFGHDRFNCVASDDARIEAYGGNIVVLDGNVTVAAFRRAIIDAQGAFRSIEAYGESVVRVLDPLSSRVTLHDDAVCIARQDGHISFQTARRGE